MLTNGNFKHQEFLDVVQQPFSFQKKKKQNTMPKRDHERRTREGGGKIKASKLDIKDLSPKQSPSLDSDCFIHHRGSRIGSEFCFHKRWDIGAGTKLKTQQQLLKSGAGMIIRFPCTVKSVREINQGFKHGWNQCAEFRIFLHRMKLDYTKSWSLWWSVRCDTSWTKVQWEFDSLREQQLRCSQYVGSWITQRLILNQHHEILNVSNDWVALSLPGWNLPCCMTK